MSEEPSSPSPRSGPDRYQVCNETRHFLDTKNLKVREAIEFASPPHPWFPNRSLSTVHHGPSPIVGCYPASPHLFSPPLIFPPLVGVLSLITPDCEPSSVLVQNKAWIKKRESRTRGLGRHLGLTAQLPTVSTSYQYWPRSVPSHFPVFGILNSFSSIFGNLLLCIMH